MKERKFDWFALLTLAVLVGSVSAIIYFANTTTSLLAFCCAYTWGLATSEKYRYKSRKITRVRLDEDDFKKLVAGGKIERGDVRIILADIGYCKMASIVIDAEAKGVISPYGKF